MSRILTAAVIALAVSSVPATAAELLTNGGFETGDLVGWTSSGPVSVGDATTAHSGLHGAVLGGPLSTLDQVVQTQPYTYYDVSVWLKIPVAAAPIPEFEVDLGGQAVIFDYDPGSFGYTDFVTSHIYVTGRKARLSIIRFGAGTPWYVDDISVTGAPYMSAPEPSTWAMMIAAFGLVGAALRFARRRAWQPAR